MKKELLFQSSCLIIIYDTRHFLYAKLSGYLTGKQWKDIGNVFTSFIFKKKCNCLLIDHSELKGTWLMMLNWLVEDATPKVIGNQEFKIAFIRARDKAAASSLDRFLELSGAYFEQVACQVFDDESTAEEWLLDQPISDKGSKNLELLPILVNGKHNVLNTEDIYYLWIKQNIVYIVTKEKTYSTRSTLTNMLQLLPPYFQQIHRGYIINLKKIDTISYYAGGSYMAYLKDFPNLRLSVSRKYAPLIKKKLGIKRFW